MRLTFLGTAASEGYPDAFCDCANCRAARALGGPSLRLRSAALVDGVLLIDLGPDLMAAALRHELSLAGLHYCLQTHEHEDHLDASHLGSRSQYCGVYGNPRLHLYATQGALRKAAAHFGGRLPAAGLLDPEAGERLNLTAHAIEPFRTYEIGPYRVDTVLAAHDPDSLVALLFVIRRAGRSLFYATDTGPLPEESWRALRAGGHRFNAVAMDHTFGLQGRSTGHLNGEQFREQVARLGEEGLLADGARVFAHHLAHHSNPPHPRLMEIATGYGYEVAYDGLTLDV
jgi:phosphoribosyl 1,2-cyclic phosphate phosphodiesterase